MGLLMSTKIINWISISLWVIIGLLLATGRNVGKTIKETMRISRRDKGIKRDRANKKARRNRRKQRKNKSKRNKRKKENNRTRWGNKDKLLSRKIKMSKQYNYE